MRTLRPSFALMAILLLLGGLSGAASAQDEGDVKETFTMKVTGSEYGYWGDAIGRIEQVEATDPRLSGTWSTDADCVEDVRNPSIWMCVGSVRVENEGGSWLGSFESYGLGHPSFGFSAERTVLQGQDGYEGLTVIMVPWEEQGEGGMGVISSLELPPVPDMPPAAE